MTRTCDGRPKKRYPFFTSVCSSCSSTSMCCSSCSSTSMSGRHSLQAAPQQPSRLQDQFGNLSDQCQVEAVRTGCRLHRLHLDRHAASLTALAIPPGCGCGTPCRSRPTHLCDPPAKRSRRNAGSSRGLGHAAELLNHAAWEV